MAQKVQVLLVDDLDGGEAHETVTFGLDGKAFEIDLSAVNAEKLRELLEPFRVKARRSSAGRAVTSSTRRSAQKDEDGPSTAEIREWAQANGYEMKSRGRVPAEIREAYAAATA
ncbi:histone-like nucleoid-structuring protein Lsr2 [Streptomyces wuyuanensis]|uniref:histone-like nucleoid-structuring protein Lsr2 n=1 Tax=Streptomyces wuyuanensis TaxID=1196353 RepID=UPI0034120792